MEFEKRERIRERIECYLREIIDDEYKKLDEEEKEKKYKEIFSKVFPILYLYAKKNNYWWEEHNELLAYYQMRTDVIVVSMRKFRKWYRVLVGRDYNAEDLRNPETKEQIMLISERNLRKKFPKR